MTYFIWAYALGQTMNPLSLIIIAEYKAERVLYFATGIFFSRLWMCEKEENFTWLDYLVNFKFFTRMARSN